MPGKTASNEAWLTYLIKVEPSCDSLRALIIQLGGQLILELTRHEGQELVRNLMPSNALELEPTLEILRTLAVPAACRHAHRHLLSCGDALVPLTQMWRNAPVISHRHTCEMARRLLQSACEDLRWASQAIPGLNIVNLSEACCACHPVLENNNPDGIHHESLLHPSA